MLYTISAYTILSMSLYKKKNQEFYVNHFNLALKAYWGRFIVTTKAKIQPNVCSSLPSSLFSLPLAGG